MLCLWRVPAGLRNIAIGAANFGPRKAGPYTGSPRRHFFRVGRCRGADAMLTHIDLKANIRLASAFRDYLDSHFNQDELKEFAGLGDLPGEEEPEAYYLMTWKVYERVYERGESDMLRALQNQELVVFPYQDGKDPKVLWGTYWNNGSADNVLAGFSNQVQHPRFSRKASAGVL